MSIMSWHRYTRCKPLSVGKPWNRVATDCNAMQRAAPLLQFTTPCANGGFSTRARSHSTYITGAFKTRPWDWPSRARTDATDAAVDVVGRVRGGRAARAGEAVAKAIAEMQSDSMRMTVEQIVDEIREWPEEDVAELVHRIYHVKYDDIPLAVKVAWHAEIHRRIADLESGRVQRIPLEETLAKARAIIDP